ncbi:hypothetical protein GCM10025331_67340 [Actinoplanes utahensis]|nr:hypothetical protein Aut01nite_53580 [Actinoplanes utahensis]
MLSGILAAVTVAVTAAGPAAADGSTAGESYLRTYMEQIKSPGLAYAVIRGDAVIERGAWGRDGDGRPMTTRTPFLLGSTSKSFTALAVAQLAEGGRVDLDAAASRYLPWLRLDDAVTVRRLLNHTSGLPQVWSTGLTDRYDDEPGGLTRSVRDLAGVRPVAAPGQAYEYSDANYMILGAIVESVTGDTFGAYLRGHVLGPLGMTHAAATAGEARAAGVPPGHRYYLGRPQRFEAPFDTAGVPYGFLAASLDDLTHYAIAQLNDGRYGSARILGPDAMRQMHTGAVATGHGTYGFGWQNSTLDGTGRRIVWHAGATPDYFPHIVLVPDSDLAVIIMANVYGLPMDPVLSAGAFNLARILHGAAPAAAAAAPMHVQALAGLLGIAAILLIVLSRSVFRLLRGAPRKARSRGRTIAALATWITGCAALAACAAWLVPSF